MIRGFPLDGWGCSINLGCGGGVKERKDKSMVLHALDINCMMSSIIRTPLFLSHAG